MSQGLVAGKSCVGTCPASIRQSSSSGDRLDCVGLQPEGSGRDPASSVVHRRRQPTPLQAEGRPWWLHPTQCRAVQARSCMLGLTHCSTAVPASSCAPVLHICLVIQPKVTKLRSEKQLAFPQPA